MSWPCGTRAPSLFRDGAQRTWGRPVQGRCLLSLPREEEEEEEEELLGRHGDLFIWATLFCVVQQTWPVLGKTHGNKININTIIRLSPSFPAFWVSQHFFVVLETPSKRNALNKQSHNLLLRWVSSQPPPLLHDPARRWHAVRLLPPVCSIRSPGNRMKKLFSPGEKQLHHLPSRKKNGCRKKGREVVWN